MGGKGGPTENVFMHAHLCWHTHKVPQRDTEKLPISGQREGVLDVGTFMFWKLESWDSVRVRVRLDRLWRPN